MFNKFSGETEGCSSRDHVAGENAQVTSRNNGRRRVESRSKKTNSVLNIKMLPDVMLGLPALRPPFSFL